MEGQINEGKPFSCTTLAQRWGTTRQNIHNQIKNGAIKNTFRVGDMLRIPAWEIERIEACGTKNPNSIEENITPASAPARKQNAKASELNDWMWR